MTRVEYKEFKAPDEVQNKLRELTHAAQQDPDNVKEDPTLGNAGFFDWLSALSEDGWRPVWQSFAFPFIVLERKTV